LIREKGGRGERRGSEERGETVGSNGEVGNWEFKELRKSTYSFCGKEIKQLFAFVGEKRKKRIEEVRTNLRGKVLSVQWKRKRPQNNTQSK